MEHSTQLALEWFSTGGLMTGARKSRAGQVELDTMERA